VRETVAQIAGLGSCILELANFWVPGDDNRHHTPLYQRGYSNQSVASTANAVRLCNPPPCPISNKTVQTTPRSESTSCFLVDGFPRKMDQAIAFQENVNLPFKELN
jgi:hypothetical protein